MNTRDAGVTPEVPDFRIPSGFIGTPPQPPPYPPDGNCSEGRPKRMLNFRSARIIYYGPHPCENCGAMIAKMGREFGGNSFNYPEGPIYPNTEWHPHVCDPKDVGNKPR